jgi:hypothetical protein
MLIVLLNSAGVLVAFFPITRGPQALLVQGGIVVMWRPAGGVHAAAAQPNGSLGALCLSDSSHTSARTAGRSLLLPLDWCTNCTIIRPVSAAPAPSPAVSLRASDFRSVAGPFSRDPPGCGTWACTPDRNVLVSATLRQWLFFRPFRAQYCGHQTMSLAVIATA